MSYEYLLTEVEAGVMGITLNRPESLNAFNSEMIFGLIEALEQAKKDPNIRVVTIKGAGRAFSAGGDIKAMSGNTNAYEHLAKVNQLVLTITELEKPVIAIVHGYAAGVAFSIALACDLIVAEETSKFILSFSKIGLVTDGGASYFLPRLIGTNRAKEVLFNAEPIKAEKAYDWGIVNKIYKADENEEQISELAHQLANGPGKSYEMLKKLVNQSFASDLNEMLELERLSQFYMKETNDHQEGVNAFKEKRKPNFMGN